MRTARPIILLVTVSCLLIAAWRFLAAHRRGGPGGTPALPRVEVITDPHSVGEARRQAVDRKADQLATILKEPRMVLAFDRAQMQLLREERVRAIGALKDVLKSGMPEDRVSAAILLVKLGDDSGRKAVLSLLADESVRDPLLFRLAQLEEEQAGQWPEIRSWVLKTLDDGDPKTRRAVLRLAMQLKIPEVGPKLGALLRQPGGDPDGWVASCAALLAPDVELLKIVERRLMSAGSSGDRYWLTMALGDVIKAPQSALSKQAMATAGKVLKAQAQADGANLSILTSAAQRGGKEAVDLLRGAFESASQPPLRGTALVEWARLEPKAALPLAVDALANDTLRQYAAEAIGNAAKDTHDSKLVRMLAEAASREKNRCRNLSIIAEAMLKIGGQDAKEAVEAIVARLDPSDTSDIRWSLAGMTVEKAAERLVRLGLLDRAAADRALVKLGQGKNAGATTKPWLADPLQAAGMTAVSNMDEFPEASGVVAPFATLRNWASEESGSERGLMSLLEAAGVLVVFDVETGLMPVGHDALIQDFAAASGGVFAPQAVIEIWNQKSAEDDEADYTVEFIHSEHLYRFKARNYGDWYDVEAVVSAIHTALRDAGVTKRFHALDMGGQIAMLVFAEPTPMSEMAREFGLPLSKDLARAMKEGQEYERKAIERFQEERR